jgi:hypothetical protein
MSINIQPISDLPLNLESNYNSKYIFLEKDNNGREIIIHILNNVIFGGENLYYPNILSYSKYDEKYYKIINEKTMSLGDSQVIKNYKFNLDSNKEYVNPVFFFIYNTDNYYHFIYDTLPYLISFLTLKKNIPNLKLLMNYPNPTVKNFYKFITEFLQIIGIDINDIILVEEDVIYKKVYSSTSYTHDIDSNLPPRNEIYEFFNKIVESVKNKFTNDTPKKIYISRRSWVHNDNSNIGTNYTLRRKMVNEDKLIEILNKNGYVEIFTENLTTFEKLNLFYNATNIIGSIGGGICNVLFSKPETSLLTIVSPTFLEINGRFKYSLDNVNSKYFLNTKHTCIGKFKKHMRVKCESLNIIGEIKNINNNILTIIYSNETVSGWGSQNNFKEINLDKSICKILDNGLNSPFKVNLSKLISII